MNEETYKALKDLIAYIVLARSNNQLTDLLEEDLRKVIGWIDEVEKEYD